jgi:uncharacterized protein DUF3606
MGSNSDPRNKPDQGQQQPGASSLDDNEIDDIAQRCNTNRDNVKAAIKKVGNDRSAVERELGRR